MIRRNGRFIGWRGLLLAGAFLTLGAQSSFASDKKAGTSGAPFLKIGAGARPTAMGDAFVGVADDVNAVYFNAAGLAFSKRPEMPAMHTQYIQDMNYDFGAFAFPTAVGSFGISAMTLKVVDLQKRNADESYQGTFDSIDAAYTLCYAKEIVPLLSVGVTGRYLKQEIDTASAGAWGGDVSVMKKMERLPLSLGLALRNMGPGIKFREESDPQPFIVDAGAGMRFFRERLCLGVDVSKPRDNGIQFGAGGEWTQPLMRDFRTSVRSGYKTAGTDADGASGLSLGAGLGYRQLSIDFAWVPFGDLGNTFRYAATFRF